MDDDEYSLLSLRSLLSPLPLDLEEKLEVAAGERDLLLRRMRRGDTLMEKLSR